MKITFIDDETVFWIKILERGWIDEVYLILAENIRSSMNLGNFKDLRIEKLTYISRENLQGNMYSEFMIHLSFPKAISYMEYCFFYSIEGHDYMSEIESFTVRD